MDDPERGSERQPSVKSGNVRVKIGRKGGFGGGTGEAEKQARETVWRGRSLCRPDLQNGFYNILEELKKDARVKKRNQETGGQDGPGRSVPNYVRWCLPHEIRRTKKKKGSKEVTITEKGGGTKQRKGGTGLLKEEEWTGT